jgi:glutathione S-transferase
MSLQLYMHPLSSYCHKVLIALYENDITCEMRRLDEPAVASELKAIWPPARFPVLRDLTRKRMVPESSIIIEYLNIHYPGSVRLIPKDADIAWQVRLQDRFCDLYLHTPVQKFAFDRRRLESQRDPFGVQRARSTYRTALDMLEARLTDHTWMMGDEFTLADCAAAPPLFFGSRFFGSFADSHPRTMSYLERLMKRPSYARALEEAQPFMHMVPR